MRKRRRLRAPVFFAAIAFGLALTVFGLIFIDPLMALLGATKTILPYARDYAKYILLGAAIMSSSFVLNNVLRSEGKATLAMVGITAGGLLNIVLDPIFIFTFHLGIAGAAIATILSQIISFLILLGCFLTHKSLLHLMEVERPVGDHQNGSSVFFPAGLGEHCDGDAERQRGGLWGRGRGGDVGCR